MIEYINTDKGVVEGEVWCPGPLPRTVWVLDPTAAAGAVVVRLATKSTPAYAVHYHVVNLPPGDPTVTQLEYDHALEVVANRDQWDAYRRQVERDEHPVSTATMIRRTGSRYATRVGRPATPDPDETHLHEARHTIAIRETEQHAYRILRDGAHDATSASVADRTFKTLTFKHAQIS